MNKKEALPERAIKKPNNIVNDTMCNSNVDVMRNIELNPIPSLQWGWNVVNLEKPFPVQI